MSSPNALSTAVRYGLSPSVVKLNAVCQTARQIFDEVPGRNRVTLSDEPAGDKFGLGVDGGPCPNITTDSGFHLFSGNVLLLAADGGPNLIALNPATREVPHYPVLVFGAGRADLNQQLRDGVLRNSGHADGGPDAISFHEASDHFGAPHGV
jgi:hypothetical protein